MYKYSVPPKLIQHINRSHVAVTDRSFRQPNFSGDWRACFCVEKYPHSPRFWRLSGPQLGFLKDFFLFFFLIPDLTSRSAILETLCSRA